MPNNTDPGPEIMKALRCIGAFMYRAMVVDQNVDFVVTTRKHVDGTLTLNLLHSAGTFQFTIPKHERETEVGRATALGA